MIMQVLAFSWDSHVAVEFILTKEILVLIGLKFFSTVRELTFIQLKCKTKFELALIKSKTFIFQSKKTFTQIAY